MARSVNEIFEEQKQAAISRAEQVGNDAAVEMFSNNSRVAVWRILFYAIAYCIWTLEKLFDIHKQEVSELIREMKPHSLRWYVNMAKAFQLGDGIELKEDEDFYDNTGRTDEEIEASKIVSYAAVVESAEGLRVKVAKSDGDSLSPLTQGLSGEDSNELEAFKEYMSRIKDAGVKLHITTAPADLMQLKLKIYYDPLVLNADGQRLDGTDDAPVLHAVREYLRNLPFNGYVVQAYLVDALQKVDGVVIPTIVNIQTKYGDGVFSQMDEIYNPDSGYMKIEDEDFLEPEYIAQTVI